MVDLEIPDSMEFFGDDYLEAYRETVSPENAVLLAMAGLRVTELVRMLGEAGMEHQAVYGGVRG